MPPLPSAWWRQQTSIWMGNLLASIPRLCSASVLFCEGKDLDLLRYLVIFFYPCIFNLSIPSSCFTSAQCFSSQTAGASFNPPLSMVSLRHSVLSWSSPSFRVFSFHSSLCSAEASESTFRKDPREFRGCPMIKTPFFHCREPRVLPLVRN